MIAQINEHLGRPMLNFIQHIGAVHALLMLFGIQHADEDDADTEIAWESGEDEDDRLLPPASH